MTIMLSIDPGKHQLGVATWKNGELSRAELINTPGYRVPLNVRILVIELPQIYPSRRQKGRQRDLIELASIVGRIEGSMYQVSSKEVHRYEPHAWKGQLDKTVIRYRARELLSKGELVCIIEPKPKSKAHNIYDAIGLGLVHLKRAQRGLV